MTRVRRIEIAGLGATSLLSAMASGLGIAVYPQIPEWELAMVAFVALGIFIWHRFGLSHPAGWFPVIYGSYFLIGAQNWIAVTGSAVSFRSHVDTNAVLELPFLAGVAFLAAVLMVPRVREAAASVRVNAHDRRAVAVAGAALVALGAVGVGLAVHRFGVLILHPGARAEVSGFVRLLSLLTVPGALLLAATRTSLRSELAVIVGANLTLALLAYRTPILLTIGTYALAKVLSGRMRERRLVIVGIGLIVLASAIYAVRLPQNASNPYTRTVRAVGPLAAVPGLTPLYYSSAREGVSVFSRIVDVVPASHPYFGGSVEASSIGSFLPGKQTSPREVVTELAYGTGTPLTSLTPTLLGGPYLDFGLTGVVAELVGLGLICALLYRRSVSLVAAHGAIGAFPYAYCVVLITLSIHSGLLDAMLFAALPLITVCTYAGARWIFGHKK